MNIYIVFADHHKDSSLILAVFSTEEQAKTYYKKYKNSENKDIKGEFLNKSLSKIDINTNATKIAEITFELYDLNRIQDFNLYSKLLLKKSLLVEDSVNLGKAYRCRGIYFDNAQILDSSYYYFIKACTSLGKQLPP